MFKIILNYIFLSILTINVSFAHSYPIVTDINNNEINFSTLKGKWVLINFWASWCEPCVNEIHEFNKLLKKHKNDIKIFAVNYDYLTTDEQINLANKYAIQYTNLTKSSIKILNLGDISVVPVTYIFNKQGNLATKLYGGQTVASIEKVLQDLN